MCAAMLSGTAVFAEDETAVSDVYDLSEVSAPLTSNVIGVDFTLPYTPSAAENEAVFEIYSSNGEYLSSASFNVTKNGGAEWICFAVPEYTAGTSFWIKLVSGVAYAQFYDYVIYPGDGAWVTTSAYTDDYGNDIVYNNFAMSAVPEKHKSVNLYKNNTLLTLPSAPVIVNETLMVPVSQLCYELGIYDITKSDAYNSISVKYSGKELLLNIGDTYNSLNGTTLYGGEPTQIINGVYYAPIRVIAAAFRADLEVYDHNSYIDVMLGYSKDVAENIVDAKYVNSIGLKSSTDYLIWISKGKYQVNVYKRGTTGWDLVKSIKCATGAASSPTCTGTYKYYEKIKRWNYDNFYVGPVMRFNGGYAIHSTLLNYDGSTYNDTVGKQLSHGCVRVRPNDMNWLAETIPMYTTIHVTDE